MGSPLLSGAAFRETPRVPRCEERRCGKEVRAKTGHLCRVISLISARIIRDPVLIELVLGSERINSHQKRPLKKIVSDHSNPFS